MSGYYETKTTTNGKFMFTLKAGNHEVILTSQTYESRETMLAGIESVRKNGPNAGSFEKLAATNGEPYFVLKATNGQVIGTSQMYSSEAGRDNGIASVTQNAGSEKVVEAAE